MKASDVFVSCLESEGVEYVFGVPGEENLDLIESLRPSRIQLVVTRHEQHAAFMAATYGRLTGRAGVCFATLGPGATNLLTGIAHAQLGGMPLVAITGQKALRGNLQGKFQLVDVVGSFRPLTKWNTTIAAPDEIARSIAHAFVVAEDEHPGAVHLELPEDVAGATTERGPYVRSRPRRPVADDEAVREALALLERARNPVAIVGSGANRKRVGEQLRRFVEVTGAHAVSTQMGKGVLSDEHQRSLFSLGVHKRDYAHCAIDRADLVITIGYDIVEYPPSVWNERLETPILHVDFRPAEPDEFYHPELELVGDVARSLAALAEGWGDRAPLANPEMWELRERIDRVLHRAPVPDGYPPSPSRVVREVRAVLGRDDILCLDNGIYKLWFARMYPTYAENTVLLDNALATMGAGLASAMAAKLVHPERKVLAVCGDGGFLMNGQDLETAVRLGLDLVVLLLRDDGYGFIRWKQADSGFEDYGMTFGNPDFVRYAEAYGATGLRVEETDRLPDVLREALALRGPVLVDCPIDYAENAELSTDLAARVRTDGDGREAG